MRSILLAFACVLSLLAVFTPGSAKAGDHYYGEAYYGGYVGGGRCSSCCDRGLFTAPCVYVVPAPVYVVPAPVYVAPARRVYVDDYAYRRRGVYVETNRYYRRGYYGY